jgi:hypothetical protein
MFKSSAYFQKNIVQSLFQKEKSKVKKENNRKNVRNLIVIFGVSQKNIID